MKKQFADLPGWEFEIEEVSAGVYRVIGHDRHGHRISFTGVDPDALVEQCRSAIALSSRTSVDESSARD